MNLIPWRSNSLSPIMRNYSDVEDEVRSLQRGMNNLMNTVFNQRDFSLPQDFSTNWYPPIDLKEDDNKYLVDADVPGIKESDLDIEFHNNTLTIKGDTKSEVKKEDSGYIYVERSSGTFRRDLLLDKEVDENSIKAELRNGVLHIEMAKTAKSKAEHKKIAIKH